MATTAKLVSIREAIKKADLNAINKLLSGDDAKELLQTPFDADYSVWGNGKHNTPKNLLIEQALQDPYIQLSRETCDFLFDEIERIGGSDLVVRQLSLNNNDNNNNNNNRLPFSGHCLLYRAYCSRSCPRIILLLITKTIEHGDRRLLSRHVSQIDLETVRKGTRTVPKDSFRLLCSLRAYFGFFDKEMAQLRWDHDPNQNPCFLFDAAKILIPDEFDKLVEKNKKFFSAGGERYIKECGILTKDLLDGAQKEINAGVEKEMNKLRAETKRLDDEKKRKMKN